MKLAGKLALITGASRGIGEAIATRFVLEGAALVLTARGEGLVAVAERLRAHGATVETLAGDVGDDTHARALMQLCRAKFGRLDMLVNNAGVLLPAKLGMTRMEDVRRMFDTNVHAAVNLTQYALRVFPKEGGCVLNLASIAGTRGFDGMTAYSASKAALVGFTKAAAKELAARQIRVNAIAPGFVETEMTRQFSPETMERTLRTIGLGRLGKVDDIAKAAVFLCSDDAAYITGEVLAVDGGMLA